MSYETLKIERDGHVGWLINNRPDVLNAMNAKMRDEFADAWIELDNDPEVREAYDSFVPKLARSGKKALMEGDLTLEEIANGVLRFRAQLDQLDEALISVIDAFIEEVRRPGMPETTRRTLSLEVEGLARSGDDLIKRAKEFEARLADHGKKEDNIAPVIGLRKI